MYEVIRRLRSKREIEWGKNEMARLEAEGVECEMRQLPCPVTCHPSGVQYSVFRDDTFIERIRAHFTRRGYPPSKIENNIKLMLAD